MRTLLALLLTCWACLADNITNLYVGQEVYVGMPLTTVYAVEEVPSGFVLVGATNFVVSENTTNDIAIPGSLVEGDLVIVAWANDVPQGATEGVLTTGYIAFGDYRANSGPSCAIAYKVMSETPDASVSVSAITTKSSGVVQVWRGQNATVLDVAVASQTGNPGMPNPKPITPVTEGALMLAVGWLDDDDCADVTAPSGYSNLTFGNTGAGGDVGSTTMIASKEWASGEEDPGAFGGTGDDAWNTAVIAIRPQ